MNKHTSSPVKWALLTGVPVSTVFCGLYCLIEWHDYRFQAILNAKMLLYFLFVLVFTCGLYLGTEKKKRFKDSFLRNMVTAVYVVAICPWLFVPVWAWGRHTSEFIGSIMPIAAGHIVGSTLSALIASKIENGKTTLAKWGLFVSWLMPVVFIFPTMAMVMFEHRPINSEDLIVFASLLSGPWASYFAMLFQLPHAGENLDLLNAVVLTMFAAALALGVFLSKKRAAAGGSLIVWNAMMGVWYLNAIWQIRDMMR